MIDTYWSDHCRHTTFLTRLTSIEVESGALSGVIEEALSAYYEARKEVYGDRILSKNVTLMDMATMGMRLLKKQGKIPDLDESDEINACSIEVPHEVDGKPEKWLVPVSYTHLAAGLCRGDPSGDRRGGCAVCGGSVSGLADFGDHLYQ